jgi:hypothetical protein
MWINFICGLLKKKHLINGEKCLLKKKLRDAVKENHAMDRINTFSSDTRGGCQGPLYPRREVQYSLE